MKSRSWPVFLLALGTLVGLIFLPGEAAIRKTQSLSEQFRKIQERYDRNSQILNGISGHLYTISIIVREFLLDSSPSANRRYEERFEIQRQTLDQAVEEIRKTMREEDLHALDTLSEKMSSYWVIVREVLRWSPAERTARATYYLREQQRPHREDIQQLTDDLARLNRSNYLQQFENIEASQRQVRTELLHAIWLAVALGVLVTIASVARIWMLEHRSAEHRRRLENLSSDLIRVQEEERRMISRELHDEVGQMVTGLKMELAALDRLRAADPADFSQHLSEAKDLADRTLRTVRNLAAGLRPSVLDLGIVPALQSLARDVSRRSGLDVQVEAKGELDHLPERHLVCVYRVVQEALNNCVKHARATHAIVRVVGETGDLRFEIQDDGIGFSEQKNSGMGLAGIEERIRELGGTVEIDGAGGKGTLLRAAVHIA